MPSLDAKIAMSIFVVDEALSQTCAQVRLYCCYFSLAELTPLPVVKCDIQKRVVTHRTLPDEEIAAAEFVFVPRNNVHHEAPEDDGYLGTLYLKHPQFSGLTNVTSTVGFVYSTTKQSSYLLILEATNLDQVRMFRITANVARANERA